MNKKKLLCCLSLVRDLVIVGAFDEPEKLERVLKSEDAAMLVKYAESVAHLLEGDQLPDD